MMMVHPTFIIKRFITYLLFYIIIFLNTTMRFCIRFQDPFIFHDDEHNTVTSQVSFILSRRNTDLSIAPPALDDDIDLRLLLDLAELERTINRNPDYYTREEQILSLMCRELKTVGYRHIKAKMDRGDVPLGDLRYGSAWTSLKVGPVLEFIAPLDEVEEMWCVNQKAIDIIDRWPTFDDYYDVWNGRLGSRAGTWDKTVVCRGYNIRNYIITGKYPSFPVTYFEKLDRETLMKHWNRASVRVEALMRIDHMKDRIRDTYRMRQRRRMREVDNDAMIDNDGNYHINMRRRLG